jgi:hypothetical protein
MNNENHASANASSEEVQFTPTEVGDLSTIAPDAPEGGWVAAFRIKKKGATKPEKGAHPMLTIEALMQSADDAEHECFLPALGNRGILDWITFYPKGHANAAMATKRLHAFCKALNIEIPRVAKLNSWDDLAEFTDAIESVQARVWTYHEKDKRTGEIQTRLAYAEPKKKSALF